jgi:hypothetical protein
MPETPGGSAKRREKNEVESYLRILEARFQGQAAAVDVRREPFCDAAKLAAAAGMFPEDGDKDERNAFIQARDATSDVAKRFGSTCKETEKGEETDKESGGKTDKENGEGKGKEWLGF